MNKIYKCIIVQICIFLALFITAELHYNTKDSVRGVTCRLDDALIELIRNLHKLDLVCSNDYYRMKIQTLSKSHLSNIWENYLYLAIFLFSSWNWNPMSWFSSTESPLLKYLQYCYSLNSEYISVTVYIDPVFSVNNPNLEVNKSFDC